MSQSPNNHEDPRLAEMLDVIFKFAAGDLTARGTLSDDDSALDGVMAGINILGEELEAYVAENKQVQQALSESESLLRSIFDSVQDGIILADAQTRRFRMVNASFCHMLGYNRDELLNLGMEGIHPEEDIANVAREFERMANGGIGLAPNVPMKRKDGTVFYADASSGPMIVNGVACLVGVFRDITERRRAEQALSESENQLKAVFNAVQDGIIVADIQTKRFRMGNTAICRMLGYRLDEFLNLGIEDIHPEADLPNVAHQFERQLKGELSLATLPVKRKDGTVFYADVTADPVTLGGRIHLVGVFRDITERKKQEQALRESEERFNSILENVAEMFFITDSAMHAEYMSPRCLDIYGYSEDEFIANPTLWIETLHPQDRVAVKKQVAEVVLSGASAVTEFRIIRKDGLVRWVRSVSNPLLGSDGKLQRIYGTLMDITEYESLRSSLKEKEVLLKEIHHRVKNNLQIIISLMRLESRAFSEERIKAVLKDLETRIRAMALVHEHLYHSSDLAKIGFKDYLKGLCEELFRTYDADSSRIRLEIDAEAVVLDIERAIPCGLIINELLTNAIKHAFPGNRKGVLRVAIRNTPDNEVEILVSDDGIGIPETLDIRHAKSLGLQLVFTLAENQLKGRVELARASGTQFRIRFTI